MLPDGFLIDEIELEKHLLYRNKTLPDDLPISYESIWFRSKKINGWINLTATSIYDVVDDKGPFHMRMELYSKVGEKALEDPEGFLITIDEDD